MWSVHPSLGLGFPAGARCGPVSSTSAAITTAIAPILTALAIIFFPPSLDLGLAEPAPRDAELDGLLDRDPHEASPLRPGAVVALHPGIAEQVREGKPGQRGPLSDAAVRDDLFVRRDPPGVVQLHQVFVRLER